VTLTEIRLYSFSVDVATTPTTGDFSREQPFGATAAKVRVGDYALEWFLVSGVWREGSNLSCRRPSLLAPGLRSERLRRFPSLSGKLITGNRSHDLSCT
jgi:hypothetical protein